MSATSKPPWSPDEWEALPPAPGESGRWVGVTGGAGKEHGMTLRAANKLRAAGVADDEVLALPFGELHDRARALPQRSLEDAASENILRTFAATTSTSSSHSYAFTRGDVLVPVVGRFAKAWPTHRDEAGPAAYGPIAEACATAFADDAHVQACCLPDVPHRLGGEIWRHGAKMVLAIFDVDGPGHERTDAWWAGEREKVRRLFRERGDGYCYTTSGGYRVVYALREELLLDSPEAMRRWTASYLDWCDGLERDFGIAADKSCADPARLFRLPRVRRDGIDVVPAEEIGEVSRMLRWSEPYCAPDDPRVLRQAESIEVTDRAPVDDERQIEAARALAAAWPLRARHGTSLALAGALAKGGWSIEAIADFVHTTSVLAGAANDASKRLAQARASYDTARAGRETTGWGTLIDLMCTGADARIDEARRPAVEAAVTAARKALGMEDTSALAAAAFAGVGATALRQALGLSAVVDTSELQAAAGARLVEVLPGVSVDGEFAAKLERAAKIVAAEISRAQKRVARTDPNPLGMTARALMRRDVPPPAWLVRSLVTREGVGALSGEPKSGKSWDATHLAVAIASGKPVFGRFVVDRPAGVFYFYSEDTEAAVKTRITAIATGMDLPADGDWLDRLTVQPRGRALDLTQDADICVFIASVWQLEEITGVKCELVIIDPLSNVHSGEEDKRDSMAPLMARLHALEHVLKAAILFVHHSAKTSTEGKGRTRGGQRMRGSGAIHAAIHFGIYLSNLRGDSKNEFVARVESEVKAARGGGVFDRSLEIADDERGNATLATFSAHDVSDDARPKDLADERSLKVLEALFDHGAPLSRDEIKRKVRGDSQILENAINALIQDGLAARHFEGKRSRGFVITDAGRERYRGAPAAANDQTDAAPAHLAAWAAKPLSEAS